MDLRVVLLQDRPGDPLQVLAGPVDMELTCNRVHEALVPFEHFLRPRDPPHRQERSVGPAEARVRVREPLPVGEASRTGDPERVECGPRDRDRVRGLRRVEAKGLGDPPRDRVRALGRVVEPLRADRASSLRRHWTWYATARATRRSGPFRFAYSARAKMAPRLSLGWHVSPFAR